MMSFRRLALLAAFVIGTMLTVFSPHSGVEADFHEVQINRVMAGAFGDDDIEFVELRMLNSEQNCVAGGKTGNGPFGCEPPTLSDGARLVFFDALGNQAGQFIFPDNVPVGIGGRSILIGTPEFAQVSPVQPDFIMPSNVMSDSGKVCYRNIPGASEGVNECLSYGNFTGSTDGFGSPAAVLPTTGSQSLSRTSTTGDNATDFGLVRATLRNNSNDIATSGLAVLVQPSNTAAGDAISASVQVEVRDAFGNREITATDSIAISVGANPSGGALSGTTAVSAVNGVAIFSDLSIDQAGTGYTLIASAPGLKNATSAAFDIMPGVSSRLAFIAQPIDTIAGSIISAAVQVELQDAFGNRVVTGTDSITIAIGTNPGGGALSGTTTVGVANGVATFADLSIDNIGAGYTLIASAPNLTGALSASFNITTIAATQLAFISQPSSTTAGTTLFPAVQAEVQDATGNRVTTATNNITVAIGANPSGGTLSGTTTVSTVNGVATFSDLRINNVGVGYTLIASSPGPTDAVSGTFDITAGAALQLAFAVQPTNTPEGSTISPAIQVEVRDVFGNVVTTAIDSVTIGLDANPSGGILSGTTTVDAVNGVATFSDLRIDGIGAGYALVASTANLIGATSTAFIVTSSSVNNPPGTGCSVSEQQPTPGAAELSAVAAGAMESGALETGAALSALLLLLGMIRGTVRRIG